MLVFFFVVQAFYNFRSKYATLYFKFKPRYYFWILVVVVRKLLIVTFTLLFHINATMQFAMILLVIFLAFTLQVNFVLSPFSLSLSLLILQPSLFKKAI